MSIKFIIKKLLTLPLKKLHLFNSLVFKNVKSLRILNSDLNNRKNIAPYDYNNKYNHRIVKEICMNFFDIYDDKVAFFLEKKFCVPEQQTLVLQEIHKQYYDKVNLLKSAKINKFLDNKYIKENNSIKKYIFNTESAGGFKSIFLKKTAINYIDTKQFFLNNFDKRYIYLKNRTYGLNLKNTTSVKNTRVFKL